MKKWISCRGFPTILVRPARLRQVGADFRRAEVPRRVGRALLLSSKHCDAVCTHVFPLANAPHDLVMCLALVKMR